MIKWSMMRLEIVGLLLVTVTIGYGQQRNVSRLNAIKNYTEDDYSSSRKRIEKFLEINPSLSKVLLGQGRVAHLVDISPIGKPMYYTTFNASVAKSVGASELNTGGSLGMDLNGANFLIGIWDGGAIKPHVEFGPRISAGDAANNVSNHSTHVLGTMIAEGVNASAKGMAPQASAISYDFNNHLSEMATAAANGLLLSNHSYGLLTGWDLDDSGVWQWFGDQSISGDEDYQFGYYSSVSQTIDDIAYHAPYYTIVWSSGNDKNDVGDGTRPPDGNGGGGFDLIGPEGTAKNNLTIGAVQKFENYEGPASVSISDFSSAGPVDDGRIKPDLVGVGVNLLSTGSAGDNTYTTLSGTSMSAPNVTGTLALLQELHALENDGNYMKSATVKALTIHTTRELGNAEGPDYTYGWGLLNAVKAAELIMGVDEESVIINETSLADGESYTLTIHPKRNTPVTVTIAWTDVPASPLPAGLDIPDARLVNDLDIRITDDAGNEIMPWVLDPADPQAAAERGDNFRDNVERINFFNPEPRPYYITVSHKGSLVGGNQDFSIIVENQSDLDTRSTYYWIGGSGEWEVASNWSLESGGVATTNIPGINDHIVIDENSFTEPNSLITISENVSCFSLTWLAKELATLSLGNSSLTVGEDMVVTGNALEVIDNGTITLQGFITDTVELGLNGVDLDQASIIVNQPSATLNITEPITAKRLEVQSGQVNFLSKQMKINEFISSTNQNKTINAPGVRFEGLQILALDNSDLMLNSQNATFSFKETDSEVFTNNNTANSKLIVGEGVRLVLHGNNLWGSVTNSGSMLINADMTLDSLGMLPGSTIDFNNSNLLITDTLVISSSGDLPVSFVSDQLAEMQFSKRYKLCFDFLTIENINLIGPAVVSIGENSSVIDAENWAFGLCEDAIFPNFEILYPCVDGLSKFVNSSEGSISSNSWFIDDNLISDESDPYFSFDNIGTFQVQLVLQGDDNQTKSFESEIEVIENTLGINSIIRNGEELISELSGLGYQWFINGDAINGEVGRRITRSLDGVYSVAVFDEVCGKLSDGLLITATEDADFEEPEVFKLFPNPSSNGHMLLVGPSIGDKMTIVNSVGQVMMQIQIENAQELVIESGKWPNGIYTCIISSPDEKRFLKLIKQ